MLTKLILDNLSKINNKKKLKLNGILTNGKFLTSPSTENMLIRLASPIGTFPLNGD